KKTGIFTRVKMPVYRQSDITQTGDVSRLSDDCRFFDVMPLCNNPFAADCVFCLKILHSDRLDFILLVYRLPDGTCGVFLQLRQKAVSRVHSLCSRRSVGKPASHQ
ncbi:MAG TPA: hypothetical protein PKJ02_06265, partial [Candidatus Avimonas sp.]|nr:hypothetical protein [Candidatus Avimonas sp.]